MIIVSVIIPTYNRADLISITLDSLLNQDYPSEFYEILVVDNNSTDNTKEVVKEYQRKTEAQIKYYFEARQGSHFARNNVVKYAQGELLYFTDDDMIADVSMLSFLVKLMQENQEIATATGQVLPKWLKEPPAWVKKYCTNGWLSLYDREEQFFLSENDFGVFSCHQIVRKNLFIESGGYNPDIVNGEWIGDNETGLNLKLKALGGKFAFLKKALTFHVIPPFRMTQTYLNKRFANQGNCDCYTDYRKCHFLEKDLNNQNKQFLRLKIVRGIKYIVSLFFRIDKWHIHRAFLNYYHSRIEYNKKLIKNEEFRLMVLKNNWID